MNLYRFQAILFTCLLFSIVSPQTLTKVFVSVESSCYIGCSGSFSSPYRNLWSALQENQNKDTEYIMMPSSSNKGHTLQYMVQTSTLYYEYPQAVNLTKRSIIRPLFCNDTEASGPGTCLDRSQSLTIFLKNESLQINIFSSLSLINLRLDALENIHFTNAVDAKNCTQSEDLCCNEISVFSLRFPQIRCLPNPNIVVNRIVNLGFFFLSSASASLSIENSSFTNFHFQSTRNLIYMDFPGTVVLNNVIFNKFYFYDGIITNKALLSAQSTVVIRGCSFSTYNQYNFISLDTAQKGLVLNLNSRTNLNILQTAFSQIGFRAPAGMIIVRGVTSIVFISDVQISRVNIIGSNLIRNNIIWLQTSIIQMRSVSMKSLLIIDALALFIESGRIDLLSDISFEASDVRSAFLPCGFFQVVAMPSFALQNMTFDGNLIGRDSPFFRISLLVYPVASTRINITGMIISNNIYYSRVFSIGLNGNLQARVSDIRVFNNQYLVAQVYVLYAIGTVFLNSATYTNNSAPVGTSYIYFAAPGYTFILFDMTIDSNMITSTLTGPALFEAVQATATFFATDLTVSNNNISGLSLVMRLNQRTLANFANFKVLNNTVGAISSIFVMIYVMSFSNVTFTNCTFSNNNFKQGSFIYFDQDNSLAFDNGTVSNNIFPNSNFEMNLFYFAVRANVSMTNLTIDSNYLVSPGRSSIISIITNGRLTFKHLVIKNNQNLENFIMISSTNAKVIFDELEVSNNTFRGLETSNVLLRTINSDITIMNAVISGNNFSNHFRIFFCASSSSVLLNNIIVQNNSFIPEISASFFFEIAYSQGLNAKNLFILDNTIESNDIEISIVKVNEYLGNGVISLEVARNTLFGVKAHLIDVDGISGSLEIQNSSFYSNQLISNSKLLNFQGASLTLSNMILRNNTLKKSVVFSIVASQFTASDVKIILNSMHDNSAISNFNTIFSNFVLANITATENILQKSNLFKFAQGTNPILQTLTLSQNELFVGSALIYISTSANVVIENLLSLSNSFYDSSYLIEENNDANLILTNLTVEKNLRKREPTNFDNSQIQAIIYISSSSASFENLQSSSSTNLFYFISSTVEIKNIVLQDLIAIINTRGFITSISSINTIENLTIDGKSGQNDPVNLYESWISSTTGTLNINRFTIQNIQIKSGYFINLFSTNLFIASGIFMESYVEKGLIISYQGQNLELSKINIVNSGLVLDSRYSKTITIKELNFSTIRSYEYIFKIENASNVSLEKMNVLSNFSANNIANSGVYLQNIGESLSILNSGFFLINSIQGAVYINIPEKVTNVTINSCQFANNSAAGGYSGAITIDSSGDSIYRIENCSFNDNRALIRGQQGGRGGAIYYSSSQKAIPNGSISNCNLVKNYADKNGGAIFINGVPPVLSSLTFEENFIKKYQNNIASQAINLQFELQGRLLEVSSTSLSSIGNIGSGMPLNNSIKVYLKDILGQTAIDDSSSLLFLNTSSQSKLKTSVTSVRAIEGIFTIPNLEITFEPGSSSSLTLQTDGIIEYPGLGSAAKPTLELALSFRDCRYGEVLQPDGSCLPCAPGYASFDLSKNTRVPCKECDLSAMDCFGGAAVSPKAGHWRLDNTSEIFVKCVGKNSCLGRNDTNEIAVAGKCSYPYKGNVCSDCEDGYIFESDSCNLCSENQIRYMVLVLGIVYNLLILRSSIHWSIKEAREYLRLPEEEKYKVRDSSSVMKIFVTFLQLSSLIGGLKLNWPNFVLESVNISEKIMIAAPKSYSMKCLYPKDSLNQSYIDLILVSVAPWVYIVFCWIVWTLWFKYKKKAILGNEYFKYHLVIILIVVCFNFQVPVLQANLQLYQCVNLYRDDNPKLFLEKNYDIACWSEEHTKWAMSYALPHILFWGIVLPAILFIQIARNKKNFYAENIIMRYSFIYKGYKPSKFYWEFVVMLRKYILIIICIFGINSGIKFQIFAAFYLMLISYLLEAKLKPYNLAENNALHTSYLRSLCLLALAGILCYFIPNRRLVTVFLAFWGVASIAFFVLWFKSFITYVLVKKLKTKILEVKKVMYKIKCLKKLFKLKEIKDEDSAENSKVHKSKQGRLVSINIPITIQLNLSKLSKNGSNSNKTSPQQSQRSIEFLPDSLFTDDDDCAIQKETDLKLLNLSNIKESRNKNDDAISLDLNPKFSDSISERSQHKKENSSQFENIQNLNSLLIVDSEDEKDYQFELQKSEFFVST